MTTFVRNATVALGAAATTVISDPIPNGKRKLIIISNLNAAGGNDVFVSVGEEAAANKGVRISPGASANWAMDAGYKPTELVYNGYAAGATNLAVYEELEV